MLDALDASVFLGLVIKTLIVEQHLDFCEWFFVTVSPFINLNVVISQGSRFSVLDGFFLTRPA